MNYQDDLQKGFVNAQAVGIRTGTALADALAPTDDGYDHLRGIKRMGTVLQDGAQDAYNPEPKED